MAHDAFISYSQQDKSVAETVCHRMEAADVRCWIAPRDIGHGKTWDNAVVDGITAAKLLVLIFSAAANASRNVLDEVATALDAGLSVIPFRIEDIRPTGALRLHLGRVQWLDALTPPLEEHIDHLIESAKRNLPASQQDEGVLRRAQDEEQRREAGPRRREERRAEEAAPRQPNAGERGSPREAGQIQARSEPHRRGRAFGILALVTASLVGLGIALRMSGVFNSPQPAPPQPLLTTKRPVLLDQGPNWTQRARSQFYSQDQGSRIMPLRWMQALKQPNGEPFMAESLVRYGYLPNSDVSGVPIGFTVDDSSGEIIGMTCSACHTRQITMADIAYRVDGGPAIVDFQTFLADLDTAVNSVLTNGAAFSEFAQAVLGHAPTPQERANLRQEVSEWFYPYHTLITRALPPNPWGPARFDAVGMIFNRLTGLDIGPGPTHVIADNIRRADAPVRYPFLWNSPAQDKTQWPGFADNGNDILGLSRNLGEVYGVFAVFRPEEDRTRPLGIDYLNENSANFDGLSALEGLVKKIGPPKWPFAIDAVRAKQGEAIYGWPKNQGGCAECHGIRPGATRFFEQKTWATPIQDVGTDTREYDILGWTAQSGVLSGAEIPFVLPPLQPRDKSVKILGTSVVGSILQQEVPLRVQDVKMDPPSTPTPETSALKGAFDMTPAPHANAYEARVLEGIWAAAPYLHNGSVPTLADLLKPASERPSMFQIGPAYDPEKVGLAAQQTMFNYTLKTTDCSDLSSGNSRCGHEFGTQLSPVEKRALLEYLKVL